MRRADIICGEHETTVVVVNDLDHQPIYVTVIDGIVNVTRSAELDDHEGPSEEWEARWH